jgi:hypothetical protein
VKPGFLHWRNPHGLDAPNRIHLLYFTKLILVELQEGFILLVITDIHWGSGLGGASPKGSGCKEVSLDILTTCTSDQGNWNMRMQRRIKTRMQEIGHQHSRAGISIAPCVQEYQLQN